MTATVVSEPVLFPVKVTKINRDERILSYAIGPMIRGRRAPSVLRLRLLPGNLLQIENLTKGVWRAIAHAADDGPFSDARQAAYKVMHDLNEREMHKRNLRTW